MKNYYLPFGEIWDYCTVYIWNDCAIGSSKTCSSGVKDGSLKTEALENWMNWH
jgi:hypothetical protein